MNTEQYTTGQYTTEQLLELYYQEECNMITAYTIENYYNGTI